MIARDGIATVLFDVDGTLIDSNAAHATSWARALTEHGIETTPETIRPLVGMGGDKLLPKVAGLDEQSEAGKAIVRRKKKIFDELLPSLVPTPGARALLEYLRDRQIAVVIATSADDKELNALLTQAGVADLIPTRTSKDDAQSSKPDPDVVHAALEKSGARPDATVMVGDTPYDIEAAARAQVATIALRCGGHWRDRDLRGAVGIFDNPAALLAAWQP